MKITKWLLVFSISIIIISCSDDSNNPVIPDNTELTRQALLDEINLARTNPTYYAQILEGIKQYFNGLDYSEPGSITIRTNEGVAAVNEAINVLKNQNPLPALILSDGLSEAAQAHVNDIGPKGLVQHEGSDGTEFNVRIEKFVKTDGWVGENISFGDNKTARQIILQLIIDDGVPSRDHRENILSTDYHYVGFGWGSHSLYQSMCVVVFARIVN